MNESVVNTVGETMGYLLGFDWVKIAGSVAIALNLLIFLYCRGYAYYLFRNPSIRARNELFNYIVGLLSNAPAWYKVDDYKVGFNVDIRGNAATNGTTGSCRTNFNASGVERIVIDYQNFTVLMPNHIEVMSTLSERQRKRIVKLAKKIGGELDEIAKAQAIMSLVPRNSLV